MGWRKHGEKIYSVNGITDREGNIGLKGKWKKVYMVSVEVKVRT